MATVLLLNNTEHYHAGCKKVIEFFKKEFSNHTLIIPKTLKNINVNDYDLIILNGEGSMHSSNVRPKMIKWLSLLNEAFDKGIKTALVNTVWQNNSPEVTKMLEKISYVSVREIKSKNEILKIINKHIDVFLDLSYYIDPVYSDNVKESNIVVGNRYVDRGSILFNNFGEDAQIDIFTEDWNTIVSKLKKSKILITGRHHEMYAACKARCPFVILEGNSHKNQGLIETFNIQIPVLPIDSNINEISRAIVWTQNNTEQFENLFNSMESYPAPEFSKNLIVHETMV